jgi:hypothetical protein
MGNRWCLVKWTRPAPYPNPMYMANKGQQQPYSAAGNVPPWNESGNSLGCYLIQRVCIKYGKQVVFSKTD